MGSLQDEIKIWRSLRTLNDRSIKSLRHAFWSHIKQNQETTFDFYGSLYWVKSYRDHIYILAYRYPPQEATYLIALQNAHSDYEHAFFIKNTLYINYFFTFLMITILILFLSIWCAFYLARGISKPIQELLDATGKISKGQWNTHIHTNPTNDLFLLAQGFNHMTEALHTAQSSLEQKNYEMITILENLSASVLFINHLGRITFHNNAAQEFVTQWIGNSSILNNKINIFGKDIVTLCFAIIRELKTARTTHVVKQIMLPLKEQQRILTLYCSFITHTNVNQPGTDGLLLVIEDITDLIKINKLKIWQEAAKQMAHEIKNPLTPIQLATQRLQRKFGPAHSHDQTFYEITNTILHQVHVIKNLVSHFSAFASLPSPIIQRFDLVALIDELVRFYQESFVHISFIKTNFSQDLYINSDKEKLRRVFINLLDNSIRALHNTTERPTIIINLEHGTDQEISILFQDNGPGINPAVKETLFLPYVSTEKKNMGLGLAIVHDIIVQLGGSITLLQTPMGASFLIMLPR
jgi:two-component system nitrogen regulation sensor histidine kinase NtrY